VTRERIQVIRTNGTHTRCIPMRTLQRNEFNVQANMTAVHWATHYGHVEAVETLCELGANVLLEDIRCARGVFGTLGVTHGRVRTLTSLMLASFPSIQVVGGGCDLAFQCRNHLVRVYASCVVSLTKHTRGPRRRMRLVVDMV
jgi:hypothetical protein